MLWAAKTRQTKQHPYSIHNNIGTRLLRPSPAHGEFPWKITRKLWQARFIICHENFMSTEPSRYPLRLLFVRLHSNPIKFDVHIATATATAAAMGKYVFSFTSSSDATQCCQMVKYSVGRNSSSLAGSAAQLISHCHHLRISHTGRSCRYLPNMHILTLTRALASRA